MREAAWPAVQRWLLCALGVVAGFMTHEATRIVTSFGDVLAELKFDAGNFREFLADCFAKAVTVRGGFPLGAVWV